MDFIYRSLEKKDKLDEDEKKRWYIFNPDEISSTKLYKLDYQSEDDFEKDVNFSYKSSVNEQWDKKKKMLGIMDDEISSTRLYKLDYQSECEK